MAPVKSAERRTSVWSVFRAPVEEGGGANDQSGTSPNEMQNVNMQTNKNGLEHDPVSSMQRRWLRQELNYEKKNTQGLSEETPDLKQTMKKDKPYPHRGHSLCGIA